MIKLFTCYYGSRLYGTQTPTSDLDIKHVVLTDLDDLLLSKPLLIKVKKTNTEKNTRNSAEDVDEEFIPLQVFAKDFFAGQTYALELAFSIDGSHAGQSYPNAYPPDGTLRADYWDVRKETDFYKFVMELRTRFLTSNIKAMMGYVVNQASLYSFKGERLSVVRKFGALLGEHLAHEEEHKLSELMTRAEFRADVEALAAEHPKYFKIEDYDIGGGRMQPSFKLLEKTFPHSSTLRHSMQVVAALLKKYGSRAEAASVDHVDWKAMMHALRIVDEGISLLETGELEFPFHPTYVKRLLAIKRGEVCFTEVRDELDKKLVLLKELEQTTKLPAATAELKQEFENWLAGELRAFYGIKLS